MKGIGGRRGEKIMYLGSCGPGKVRNSDKKDKPKKVEDENPSKEKGGDGEK